MIPAQRRETAPCPSAFAAYTIHPMASLPKALALGVVLSTLGVVCQSAAAPVESDEQATAVAERLLAASGGRANWEATRYLSWIHLGNRLYVWDKSTGDLRVENKITVVLMNLSSGSGRAWKYGEEITDPEDRQRALDFATEVWQIDSHEFLLPFLLGGDDIRLEYLGGGSIDDRPVDRLGVTFAEGYAYSRAEYRLHIDRETSLLVQFDHYLDAGDEQPRFSVPWLNYEKHGRILLSDDRGNRRHTYLKVFDELPRSVFASPEPVPWLVEHLDSSPTQQ